MAQNTDELVHEFALAKVRASELLGADSETLNMFLNMYGQQDTPLITQALIGLVPNAHEAHSLGFSITDLAGRHRHVELAPALYWVYENTPCANCRRKAIEKLDALHRLTAELLHECPFDAEESIRVFAQVHQNST